MLPKRNIAQHHWIVENVYIFITNCLIAYPEWSNWSLRGVKWIRVHRKMPQTLVAFQRASTEMGSECRMQSLSLTRGHILVSVMQTRSPRSLLSRREGYQSDRQQADTAPGCPWAVPVEHRKHLAASDKRSWSALNQKSVPGGNLSHHEGHSHQHHTISIQRREARWGKLVFFFYNSASLKVLVMLF